MIHSSTVRIAQLVHEKSIPQPISDLRLRTQLVEETRDVVVNQRNGLVGVREHKRLPFLRLLFKDRGKDGSSELEDMH